MEKVCKGFLVVVCFILVAYTPSFAGLVGDVDSDGKIGLSEATYALQVSAGLSTGIQESYGIIWKGNWSSNQEYKEYEVVYNEGTSYLCRQDHTSNLVSELSNTTLWNILALKGGEALVNSIERSFSFNISNLAPIQIGGGGIGTMSEADLDVVTPVYWFNDSTVPTGTAYTSGITTLPGTKEVVANSELTMELFWVSTASGGDVRWKMAYSSKPVDGSMNRDDTLYATTPVKSTADEDEIYKTSFTITNVKYNFTDDVFTFSLGRLAGADTNTGKVGLLGIRFLYDSKQ